MEIFTHIKFLLRCLAIINYGHPRAELIRWMLRVFIITLIFYGILTFACYGIFKTSTFVDYIEPTLAIGSYAYFFATYFILLWKRTTIIDLLADLQALFDRGWFSFQISNTAVYAYEAEEGSHTTETECHTFAVATELETEV